ncbi:MAG: OmpA family protein, partial [Verrucomicrobia bacterium]|nr:OmpA family protein [Verrucomicrobiota bacterium]
MNKLFFTPVAALAAVLAVTGCKHEPVGLTPIPGPQAAEVPQPGPGPTLNSEQGAAPIAAAPLSSFEGYTEDRAALGGDTIHFAYDSAVIRNGEIPNLQAVAQALGADSNLKLLIEGNCDERGTEEYNRALGERRAEAARQALAGMGVDASRVRTISYGKDKPVDPGH